MQKDDCHVSMTVDVVASCSNENRTADWEINTFLVFDFLQVALRISTFNINPQLKRTKIILHRSCVDHDRCFVQEAGFCVSLSNSYDKLTPPGADFHGFMTTLSASVWTPMINVFKFPYK